MLTKKILSPHTLTILCTYQCTAACRQCCFESSPSVRGRLTKNTIIARIREAKRVFSNLKLVVFSGGEALLLKNDLFASISYCTSEGLLTRVVSNGYWGKTPHTAVRTVEKLKKAGLHELNLSTGKDHQEWVPSSNVVNAAIATAEAEIPCLITIESDTQNHDMVNEITSHPSIMPMNSSLRRVNILRHTILMDQNQHSRIPQSQCSLLCPTQP